MLTWNAAVILFSVAVWLRALPERCWLSSLVISFGLGLIAVAAQGAFASVFHDDPPGVAAKAFFLWFLAVCALCARTAWRDAWASARGRPPPGPAAEPRAG